MFYRLQMTLNLTDPDAIDDILDKLKDHQEAAITINPGQTNAEPSFYQVHICFHDQDPAKPCELIDQWQSKD